MRLLHWLLGACEPFPRRAPELADWLLARGIGSATTAQIADFLGSPEDHVRRRLHQPARRGQWVSPAHGLWIPVPAEYRTWGAPPGIEIVDTLMKHLAVDYYVGWLSAAEIHGAAHQAPQVFQVATTRHVRARRVGRSRFSFFTRGGLTELPVIEQTTRAGHARVSTRELTVLDLAADVSAAGGIHNLATTLVDLADGDQLDVAALTGLSGKFPAAVGRRAGWILEVIAGRSDLDPLQRAMSARAQTPWLLDPTGPTTGATNRRWELRINREVEEESW